MPERFKSPELPSRGAGLVQSDGEQSAVADGEQGLARRKVVKVVRRVVKKVLPSEKSEAAAPSSGSRPAPAAAFSFKHDSIRTEDDLSQGVTSLMVRGRTREARPRPHRDERPEKLELEKITENRAQLEEKKEDRHAPQASGPVTQEVPPPAGIPTKSRPGPASLPALVGFLPPPTPATRKLPPLPQKPASSAASPHPIQTPPPSRPGPPSPPTGQSAVSQLEVERLSENTHDLLKRTTKQANPSVSD